jgi:FtsZ-binding cell division protein ZapB
LKGRSLNSEQAVRRNSQVQNENAWYGILRALCGKTDLDGRDRKTLDFIAF